MNNHSTEHGSDLERCAHICHECQDACLTLIPHCLSLGGEHASSSHINTLLDCVAICGASHNLLHRGSALHAHTCRACAEICEACEEACLRIGKDDEMMKKCAEACGRCAAACREMSGPAE
jgi:hypothetical protein